MNISSLTAVLVVFVGVGMMSHSPPAMGRHFGCTERSKALAHFALRYKEAPAAMGLANKGRILLEILSSKSGEWTIIVTGTDLFTCMLASGENWELLPQPSTDPEA